MTNREALIVVLKVADLARQKYSLAEIQLILKLEEMEMVKASNQVARLVQEEKNDLIRLEN